MPVSLVETNTQDTCIREVSVHGRRVAIPVLQVHGETIIVPGFWIRVACRADEDFAEAELVDPEGWIAELKQRAAKKTRIDIFTFVQKIPDSTPKYDYPIAWESIAAVRTTNFAEWWDNVSQGTRKNIRRAQKHGVVTVVKTLDDDLIRGIVDVNNDSPVRQGKRFLHYGKSFEQVREDQSAFLDRSDFVCAYLADELIGFLKIVYRRQIASLVQFLPKASHQDKRPANCLLAKAIEVCAARGVSWLTYGQFNYGNKQESSLREFKVRNGFEEIRVPRYCVPLTPWGAICTSLKLYRGPIGVLPRSVITAAVKLRSMWYSQKHKPV